jgi:hypothetical protein
MKYDVEIDIKPHQANKRQRGMFALNFTEILYLGQAKIYVCLGLPDLPYFLAKTCLLYSIFWTRTVQVRMFLLFFIIV